MQRNIRIALISIARSELGEDTEPTLIVDDFGLNHDSNEAFSCWLALRNWHILPCAGGWLDQPLVWRQDLETLQAVYNEEYDTIQGKIAVIPPQAPRDEQTGAEIRLGF